MVTKTSATLVAWQSESKDQHCSVSVDMLLGSSSRHHVATNNEPTPMILKINVY